MLQVTTHVSLDKSEKYPLGQLATQDPSNGLKNKTFGIVLQFLTHVRVTESEK